MIKEKYYWLFYLIDKKEKKKYKDYRCGDLYAYALEKPLAKKFMNERNIKKFLVKKVEATGELLSELTDQFQGGILKEIKLRTRVIDHTMGKIPIVCTSNESSMIFSTEAAYIYRPNTILNIRKEEAPKTTFLLPEWKEALNDLSYGFLLAASQGDVLLLDDNEVITFDQLEIFLSLFGSLFPDKRSEVT